MFAIQKGMRDRTRDLQKKGSAFIMSSDHWTATWEGSYEYLQWRFCLMLTVSRTNTEQRRKENWSCATVGRQNCHCCHCAHAIVNRAHTWGVCACIYVCGEKLCSKSVVNTPVEAWQQEGRCSAIHAEADCELLTHPFWPE